MKVLHDEKPIGWEFEYTCTGDGHGVGCNERLLISEEDMNITKVKNGNGEDFDYFYTFTCPCCGMETDISEITLIKRVLRNVLEIFHEDN